MSVRPAFDHGIPSEIDIKSADKLREILAASQNETATEAALDVVLPGESKPVKIVLTHGIAQTLLDMLRLVSSKQGFHVIPYGAELSTQEAADILNVSRPYLIKLIDRNEIECTKVGRHRRIKAHDLFAYKDMRDKQRDEALSEMAEMDSELGLI